MALHLLSSSGLTDRLRIPQGKLTGFLRKVEGLYNAEVPYHNATHAADVLQAIQCFVKASRLPLTDLEMFAVYIAAAIHDLDHPGLNNKFLVETHDPKAILYNDRSVLENHHLATAFTVMMRDDTNILENMDHDDSHRFRELVIGMVMATDISEHFTTLSLFKNKTSGTSPFDPTNNAGDRFALFQMFIKCADVSNLSREWNVYATWLERLQREFMAQGDEEKRRDIPVSPFMDRENVNIAASQLGFIDFICQPMIEVLVKVVTLPPMLEILSQNKDVLLLERDKDAKKKLHKSRASLGGTAGWGSSTSQDDR
ncbi:High affinity cAMP-specific 3',5'-cyclic phosphodiesterase 7A [Thoreauomyces humboldtii]|nr:High affinity cAMP-specific 3',5'-cyclic phosphodiesterase 7A [Thoreauomyces humboldtii]